MDSPATLEGKPPNMTATPIRALIIRPDLSYAVDLIPQDVTSLQGLVGGYVAAITTSVAMILVCEEAERLGLPLNRMASYLWWKLSPDLEAQAALHGCVIFTGLPDGDLVTDVNPDLVRLHGEMEQIRRSEESDA